MTRQLLLAATLLAVSACQPASNPTQQPADGKTRVAFVSNNTADFWVIAEAGCRKAEKELGVQVEFRRPPYGTAAEQKEIIETLLARGVQAIAISVNDPENQTSFLNKVASQVPLITQDNDAPDTSRVCYIGTDNYEAGKAVGKLVKEAMPDGGTVAIFVGRIEPLNARQRRDGVLDELAGQKGAEGPQYGKYKLHGQVFTDNVDQRKAKENVADVLTALQGEKNVCLVGLWAYNPPAILSAVKDAGKTGQVKIVGFDEDFNTLQGITDGHIHGTVVQQPFLFGYQAVKLMAGLAKGDKSGLPKDGTRFVPHKVVTRDGGDGREKAAEFRAELESLLATKKHDSK